MNNNDKSGCLKDIIKLGLIGMICVNFNKTGIPLSYSDILLIGILIFV